MPLTLTRAAEGYDRMAITVEAFDQMIEAGIIDADARVELIDGEIVPLAPAHLPHARACMRIAAALMAAVPPDLEVVDQVSVRLGRTSELMPDLAVVRRTASGGVLLPPDVALLVEVAGSSVRRDLQLKPPIYAAAGIPHLWVVDLAARVTAVFAAPVGDHWQMEAEVPFSAPLPVPCAQDHALILDSLLAR